MLWMPNLLSYLKQGWISFGVTRIYFVITMSRFKELETDI